MSKPVVVVPQAVLTSPAKPVTSFDAKLASLVDDMKKTLLATKNPKGVGLAAPQIGEPYRVFLTRPTEKSEVRVFINPLIVSSENQKSDGAGKDNKLEGCLSIPAIWGRVQRAHSLVLEYQDETGKKHKETFEGFLATIIQHESDHLDGILFTRRVLEQKGKLYEAAIDEDGKEVLEEITL